MITRIYLDSSSIPEGTSQINIYEGASNTGPFVKIDTIPFNPGLEYAETEFGTSDFYWYKLSLVDTAGVESELTDPVICDRTDEMLSKLYRSLDDLNRDNPAFTDSEYLIKLRHAANRVRKTEKLVQIKERDLELMLMVVKASCCRDLAYDNARYTKITLPDGISLDKGERVDHYLRLAKQLEDLIKQLLEERIDDDGFLNMAEVNVVQFERPSYFTSHRFLRRRY